MVEQTGRIKIIQNGAVLGTPFLNVASLITTSAPEQGLLGLAFHPNYAQNGWFFINYTDTAGDTVVARYSVSSNPNVANTSSAVTVLAVDQPFANHNGGHLAFGPDGYLYIGLGDGGSGGDPGNRAQNRQTLLGKILRINVNQLPYTIPSNNPFAGGGALPEIWALGLRNPWRFTFDRQTGDLYIADVGQNMWEEVNFQPASSSGGENYGWRVYEGNESFSGGSLAGVIFPVAVYNHGQGCSVTGGYVYRGVSAPGLEGIYLYGDFCSGIIWTMQRSGSAWQSTQFMDTSYNISSFGEDVRGDLYVVNHGGTVLRLESVNPPQTPTLTQTPVPTSTPAPTLTETPTPLPTSTFTPTVAETPLPTSTTVPTLTETPLPTGTETPLPTNTLEPTLTETSVPTNTDVPTLTPTSTPNIPAGPALLVDVIPAAGNPGDTVSVALNLVNVTDVYGLQTRCEVNPAVLMGVGHADGDGFDTTNSFFVDAGYQPDGSWLTAATRLEPSPPVSGNATAFSLLYTVQSAGSSAVNCSVLAVDQDGRELPLTVINGSFNGAPAEPTATTEPTAEATLTETPTETPTTEPTLTETPTETPTTEPTLPVEQSTVGGAAAYQNRPDNAGITVQLIGLDGVLIAETLTAADGLYSFAAVPLGVHTLRMTAPQHITVERPVVVETDGQVIEVGNTVLPAGDADDNGLIDTLDAALVGANFDVTAPPAPANADLNGDGLVNIADLVLVGSNFGLTAPVVLE